MCKIIFPHCSGELKVTIALLVLLHDGKCNFLFLAILIMESNWWQLKQKHGRIRGLARLFRYVILTDRLKKIN